MNPLTTADRMARGGKRTSGYHFITGVGPQQSDALSKRPKATGRSKHFPGEMNKREAAYALRLEDDKRNGEILWWCFESITLKLANPPDGTKLKGTRYTPDFCVMRANGGIEFHEVKGHVEDDAVVKFKVAAETYWMFHFVWIEKG